MIVVESVEKSVRKLRIEVKPISASLWNVTQIVATAKVEGMTVNAIAKLEIVDGEYAGAFVVRKYSSSDNIWLIETIAG